MTFRKLGLTDKRLNLLKRFKRAIRHPGYQPGGSSRDVPDQVFTNLDADPQIPDRPVAQNPSSRLDLVEALDRASTQESEELKAAGIRFCRGNSLAGAELRRPELGHVHTLGALADWLYDTQEELSVEDTKAWLRDLVLLPLDEKACLEVQRRELGARLGASNRAGLSPYSVWSFFEDGEARPFSRIRPWRSELVNRLGLGHLKDPVRSELLFWTHRLAPGKAARRPTAWDAGLRNPWWRPTGRTEPLDGSGANRGLPEAVHETIGMDELLTPIRGAEHR